MTRPAASRQRSPMNESLHVLIVDDSAVVRAVLGELLQRRGGHRVSVAADPLVAREQMQRERPDVVVLDIEMPRMDGITFLRELMQAASPVPVVVCSGYVADGGQLALRALEEGAVEIIEKPRVGVQEFLRESARLLIEAVEAAAAARPQSRGTVAIDASARPAAAKPTVRTTIPRASETIVALGASTGGTDAIARILAAMPEDSPGIVIVQHMPAPFTAAFAQRLDQLSAIEVREAKDGDLVARGQALVAPGDRHMQVVRRGRRYHAQLTDSLPVSRHRPSVDVLFESVAAQAGPASAAALLTGMGDDGAAGLRAIRDAGGWTIAQDEASCVVFGMPGAAIALGGACEVLPLRSIPARVLAGASATNARAARSGSAGHAAG